MESVFPLNIFHIFLIFAEILIIKIIQLLESQGVYIDWAYFVDFNAFCRLVISSCQCLAITSLSGTGFNFMLIAASRLAPPRRFLVLIRSIQGAEPPFCHCRVWRRRALRVLLVYRLSIRLQYNSQSPWNAYFIIERAVTQLEDVYEDAYNSDDEITESAGKALTKELMLIVQRRFPMNEGKLLAIYDLRVLRPYDDTETENYFPRKLVEESIEWHLSSFFRFYAAYGDETEIRKILIRIHRSLCKAAQQREIYNIFTVQKTLTLDKPDQSVLKVIINILSSFSSDSAVAERGFSALNRTD